LSEVQLGVVLSAFMATYAVFQVPGGAIGERVGPRLTLAALFAGWAVVTT
jgi:ACS family glucarate transporter-like MFS transporter